MKSMHLLTIGLLIFAWVPQTTFGSTDDTYNRNKHQIGISPGDSTSKAINIGSRLELFLDNYLIRKLKGRAQLVLHHPEPQEIVIIHNEPWEGNGCGYHSIFKDGDIFRMYYKSIQYNLDSGKFSITNPRVCAYAESSDGIHWKKPMLNIFDFRGSKNNNIVMVSGKAVGLDAVNETIGENKDSGPNPDAAHMAVFKDDNPNAAPEVKYKSIIRSNSPKGLLAYGSSDGIHWKPISNTPVITDLPGQSDGGYDSQNLAFWDSVKKEYRAYWRYYTEGIISGKGGQGFRAIRTATSKDFIHWDSQRNLEYEDSPPEHLYTSQVKPYYRAPHLLIGFPVRWVNNEWNSSYDALPDLEQRKLRQTVGAGTKLTESLIMVSRDGVKFKRWNEAFLRNGPERDGSWIYGDTYLAWTFVETKSSLPGASNELSLYATENAWTDKSSQLRRYTLRIDGFVSVNAPMSGGELLTKPIIFSGKKLIINFSSSIAGGLQVELLDKKGKPVPGYTLADCPTIFGDSIERTVFWNNHSDISGLEGKVISIRFLLRDADLFSFHFK